MRIARIVTAVLVFCCVGFPASGQERYPGWCDSLQHAASSDLVEFLNGVVPDEKNARCVTWAILRLGNERYEPAISALVKLLDFRRPLTDNEKLGVFLRPSLMEETYPAAESLELIGESAKSEVLRAIGSDSVSATARENATGVWMEIYKYERPKGIALLKQEEIKPNTEAVKQKFRMAVQTALKYCIRMPEPTCETAAKSGHF